MGNSKYCGRCFGIKQSGELHTPANRWTCHSANECAERLLLPARRFRLITITMVMHVDHELDAVTCISLPAMSSYSCHQVNQHEPRASHTVLLNNTHVQLLFETTLSSTAAPTVPDIVSQGGHSKSNLPYMMALHSCLLLPATLPNCVSTLLSA